MATRDQRRRVFRSNFVSSPASYSVFTALSTKSENFKELFSKRKNRHEHHSNCESSWPVLFSLSLFLYFYPLFHSVNTVKYNAARCKDRKLKRFCSQVNIDNIQTHPQRASHLYFGWSEIISDVRRWGDRVKLVTAAQKQASKQKRFIFRDQQRFV